MQWYRFFADFDIWLFRRDFLHTYITTVLDDVLIWITSQPNIWFKTSWSSDAIGRHGCESGNGFLKAPGHYLNLNVREPSYLGLTRSISWLPMPWLRTSPGHPQPWYWLCIICRSWSYLINVELSSKLFWFYELFIWKQCYKICPWINL